MAAFSLFINIVIHPVGTEARADLELIVSAASIIRGIPTRALTSYELKHPQETIVFVMELVRLSNSAILLAEKNSI